MRLPGVVALLVPPGSGRFQAGWYHAGGRPFYVNRGVGTAVLPVRFLCCPEVAVFSLIPTAPTS